MVRNGLDAGDNPAGVLGDAQRAMETVGGHLGNSEYFLPDLICSVEIRKEITELAKPRLTKAGG